MTPEEATELFQAFGDLLAEGGLAKPETYPPELQGVSRADIRWAILLWLAKQKYDGVDILRRQKLPNGEQKAALEIVDVVWQLVMLFQLGPSRITPTDGEDDPDLLANIRDAFVSVLLAADPNGRNYWKQIYAALP